jgi:predicted transcriptional regulator
MLNAVSLSASEALCLESLRGGADRKPVIARRAGLTVYKVKLALGTLASLDLAIANDNGTWLLTPRGKTADISVHSANRGHGQPPLTEYKLGASAIRLLALLDRPRRGTELMAMLGVTRQRIHQLVVPLASRGIIRFADPAFPAFAIALKDDPSTLLGPKQEHALSAFPESEATTLSRISILTQRYAGKGAIIAELLCSAGLIEKAGIAPHGDLYRLTAAGSAHWQRSTTARHADIPPLPYRSDRVFGVLSYLASQGPARPRDVGRALGVSQSSMNALVQRLKRQKMVRTQTDARNAPYELTPGGRAMLAAKNDGTNEWLEAAE